MAKNITGKGAATRYLALPIWHQTEKLVDVNSQEKVYIEKTGIN